MKTSYCFLSNSTFHIALLSLTTRSTMNIIIATSRGGGLESRLRNPTYPTRVYVEPGWTLESLAELAISHLPRLSKSDEKTHVYFFAGYCDITQRLKSKHPKYDEITYTEDPEITMARISNIIHSVDRRIKNAGAIPIFSTIVPAKLRKWNLHRLNKNFTTTLCHISDYPSMQSKLHTAIDLINNEITNVNSQNSMSTPYLHSQIKRQVGSKENSKIKYYYNHLHDGVHADARTKDKWGKSLLRVIGYNRVKTPQPDITESPKRSWKQETNPKATTSNHS